MMHMEIRVHASGCNFYDDIQQIVFLQQHILDFLLSVVYILNIYESIKLL